MNSNGLTRYHCYLKTQWMLACAALISFHWRILQHNKGFVGEMIWRSWNWNNELDWLMTTLSIFLSLLLCLHPLHFSLVNRSQQSLGLSVCARLWVSLYCLAKDLRTVQGVSHQKTAGSTYKLPIDPERKTRRGCRILYVPTKSLDWPTCPHQ